MNEFHATNPVNGKVKVLNIENSVQSALKLRHEQNTSFYNKDASKPTLARHLGLDYPKMEAMRRSPEFDDEVSAFISGHELENTPEKRTHLGVMKPERTSRGVNGTGSFTRAFNQEVGEFVTELIKNEATDLLDDDTHITPEYVKSVVTEQLQIVGNLPPLPVKPVKPVRITKTAALEDQVAKLREQLIAQGIDPDAV